MSKIAYLSFGHGGEDPGACAFRLKEKDINLKVGLACRDALKDCGLKVVCSRTKDENDPVVEEVVEANKSGAKIALSFHVNAGKGDGSESYCNPNSKKGVELAELCEKHMKKIGQNSRGVKDGMHLYFIKATKMPAVLAESGFIDNNQDNNFFDTEIEQKRIGEAYANAVLEFLGKKKFRVEIKAKVVYRAGAKATKKVKGNLSKGFYTVVKTKNGWGKLKCKKGWIKLDTENVTRL